MPNVHPPLLVGQVAENEDGRDQTQEHGKNILRAAADAPAGRSLPVREVRGQEGRIQKQLTAALEQAQAASASEHIADDASPWPVFSGRKIQEWILDRLIEISHDPDVLYNNHLRGRPNGDQINQEITEKLSQLGFERPEDEQNDTYIYKGESNDFAEKLCEFSRVRPLVLDCSSSINWLTQRAWLHFLGKERFNNLFIERVCEGRLTIKPVFLPAPGEVLFFHHSRYGKAENPLPPDLPVERGDHLWIQGPPDAYVWHPYSQANAFNVLVDKSDTGEISLVGFVSNATSTHGRWSYADLKNFLLKAYNSPLTLRDFKFLMEMSEADPAQVAPFSSWRYSSAYEWLRKNQAEAFEQALKLLEDPDADLNRLTGLLPPKCDSIRGVCMYSRMSDESVSREQLLSGLDARHTYMPFDPEVPPEREFGAFGDLIPGFETRLPHQRQLYAAMEEFYEAYTNSDHPSFPGLLLYGDKGIGKTMACRAMVRRLEEQGYRVWQADARTNNGLLSPEEKEEFEALPSEEAQDETETCIEWMLEKFKQEWEQADVIFIDDADSDDVLSSASYAIVRYAQKEEEKAFLLVHNADTPPNIEAFSSEWNTFRHIAGPDPANV